MAIGALSDYNNLNALQSLKSQAVGGNGRDPATIHKVAAQFESLFVGMMMKTMREATRSLNPDDPMNSQQSQFYEDMFDSQMSVYMSEHGGVGLTQVLERQLGGKGSSVKGSSVKSLSVPHPGQTPLHVPVQASAVQAVQHKVSNPQAVISEQDRNSFIDRLLPYARQAAQELGISVRVILAQAVLETGWGQSLRRGLNNLFGIKADASWSGAQMSKPTLEVDAQGQVRQTHAAFRNYATMADSMRDYVHFLRSNPRFTKALQCGSDEQAFIGHLGRSGYATDPHYAHKLARILDALPQTVQNQSGSNVVGEPDS